MLSKEEYCDLLNDAVKRGETIIFTCKCKVRYSGRAEAHLETGDRVVMIKSDKALLVHQPTGNNPVNYMKGGTQHSMSIVDGNLLLSSTNPEQKDSMKINVDHIYFFNSYKLQDGHTVLVKGTEQDMSNMLYTNPELVEEGFKAVSREEQTKYGFIDVMGIDKDGTLTIVECKRFKADLGAVTQLRRYVEKIMVSKGITKVRGIVAAPNITDSAKNMLEDWGFDYKNISPPKFHEEFTKNQSTLDSFK